jgi:hypothetical protein
MDAFHTRIGYYLSLLSCYLVVKILTLREAQQAGLIGELSPQAVWYTAQACLL